MAFAEFIITHVKRGEKMSHIRTATCEIKDPNQQIAIVAMREVALYFKVRTSNAVFDTQNTKKDCLIAIELGRGYGITIEDGIIKFHGDDWQQDVTLNRFKQLFERNYKSAAIKMAMQSLGYQVDINKTSDKIFIRGVKFG